MARRPLMVWIDTIDETSPKHCGYCRHWEHDLEWSGYRCGVFDDTLYPDANWYLIRHSDCLRAETFAGG